VSSLKIVFRYHVDRHLKQSQSPTGRTKEHRKMTTQIHGATSLDSQLEEFLKRCFDGLSHQVQGDSAPFLQVWSRAEDVAILGAVGSYAQGWDNVRAHLLGASKSLDWTGLSVERLLTTASGDLAVTVVLEHMTREVEGESASRTLRTTQAYRRENREWTLILRHANLLSPDDEARERELQAE
jgi:ketosteroid isomerase-like protein